MVSGLAVSMAVAGRNLEDWSMIQVNRGCSDDCQTSHC